MKGSKQIPEHGSVEDEQARALVDQDTSSMAQDDESQDLNDSEGYVVDTSDVIAIREIQDDSTELNADEMQFPEKDIVYEFPRDSEDAASNITGIDFFDPQTNAGEGHLTVQENASAEMGRIVEVETCEVDQEAMSSARPDKNVSGKPGREQKQADKRVAEKRSESSQRILTTSSSVEDSLTPKRQKLDTVFPVNICHEHPDEGHLADVEDNSSSSSCNEMEDTPEIAPPSMTTATVIPKGAINCSPAVASSFTPPIRGERSCIHEHKPSPAKLFKEPRPVKKSKPSATCTSSKDIKTTSRKNIGCKDGRVQPKRAQEAKPQAVASKSFVSDVYEDVKVLMTDGNSSELDRNSGSVDAARTDAQEAETSTSSPSDTGSMKMKTCIARKNRCNECNTRLGLCAIRCRCGNQYCAKHRYDKAHNCTFDYKAMGAEEIRRNNPRVIAEKVRKL